MTPRLDPSGGCVTLPRMVLPEIQALDDLIEKTQATLTDPAERERGLAAIEDGLSQLLSNVETYRGDAKLQLQARERTDS